MPEYPGTTPNETKDFLFSLLNNNLRCLGFSRPIGAGRLSLSSNSIEQIQIRHAEQTHLPFWQSREASCPVFTRRDE